MGFASLYPSYASGRKFGELIREENAPCGFIWPVGGERAKGCDAAQPAGSIDVEIHFGRGSAMLGAAAISRLQALGADLGKPELKGAALLVAGYTDASGGDAYNQRLSERRAGAVKRFLVTRFKVPDDTVVTVGHGKAQPKNTADPYAGENRRVQVALLPPGGTPADAPDRR
jgi:outer membrane protein OmpA-like peptidoglycan-associated protein